MGQDDSDDARECAHCITQLLSYLTLPPFPSSVCFFILRQFDVLHRQLCVWEEEAEVTNRMGRFEAIERKKGRADTP